MKKMSQRCQRAQFLHGREWTVPHQVRLLVQLLLRPNGPTSGAHALFVPEPCIHVVHQRVPTLVSIESGATTSTSSPMASACAGTQVLVSVLLRICRRWFAPSEHPFWKIFPFNFVKVRYVCSGTHVLPCFEKRHCSTWNGLASFIAVLSNGNHVCLFLLLISHLADTFSPFKFETLYIYIYVYIFMMRYVYI